MRYLFAVFLFLSLLFSLPDHSQAALPSGVQQAATIIGTAVSVGGVYTILPSTATTGVPVATASAAAGTVSSGVAVPLVVGGVALAGGYYVGGMLATDLYNLYEAATSKPEQYPNLKNALASDGEYNPTSISDLPPPGSTVEVEDGSKYNLTGEWSNLVVGTNFLISSCGKKFGEPTRVIVYVCTGPQTSEDKTLGNLAAAPASPTTSVPTWQPPSGGMVPPATAVPNMTNPDGTLKPEIESEVKDAIASGDASPSGVTGSSDSGTLAGQPITQASLEAFSRSLAQQAATTAANNVVQQLKDSLQADPTNAALQQQLQQAQAALAQAQAAQASSQTAADAALAEANAVATAANAANQNVNGTSEYDKTIQVPAVKTLPSLLNNFFDNSPLLGVVRSFQINTTDQQAFFILGEFRGQVISVDFNRWSGVLSGCGAVLLVLSHAYAVFIVVRG